MNPSSLSVFFIAGIHGVGKTTFANALAESLGIPAFSAGKLITERAGRAASADKRVANVSGNQDVLVDALRALSLDGTIILDGHFCVRNGVGLVTKIPLATFEALSLKGAILLRNSSEAIKSQILSRDGTVYRTEEIEAFQFAESEYAAEVAAHLRIPLRTLNTDQLDDARAFIIAEKS